VYDADPAPTGAFGQIIEYHHDPDRMFYQAESILSLLQRTNDILEKCLLRDKKDLEAALWFYDDCDPQSMERLARLGGL
jgi:predicted metal-dependent HD superfamily phosphohydrolase